MARLTNDDTTPNHAVYDADGYMTNEAVFTVTVRSQNPDLINWVAMTLKAAMDTVWDMVEPTDLYDENADDSLDRDLADTSVYITDDDGVIIAEA